MSKRFVVNLCCFLGAFFLVLISGAVFAVTLEEALAACQTTSHSPGCKPPADDGVCTVDNVAGTVKLTGTYCNGTWIFTPEPDLCSVQLGLVVSLEFFVGYTTSPGADSVGSPVTPPDPVNYAGCQYSRGAPTRCYVYESNTSQAYCAYDYTNMGIMATGGETPSGVPTSACPAGQQIGYVNGKGGCYATGGDAATAPKTTQGGSAPTPGGATTVAPTAAAPGPSDGSASDESVRSVGTSVNNVVSNTSITNNLIQQLVDKPSQDQCALHPSSAGCVTPTPFGSPGVGTGPAAPSSWYTSKYPSGLHGVWDARKAQLFSTPLGAALGNMVVPSSAGSAPVWTFTLWRVAGTYSLSLPAWIWAVVKSILLLSAAFACRRIVFGG